MLCRNSEATSGPRSAFNASDLTSLTLGQLLGMVLFGVSLGERRAHQNDHDSELANGSFQGAVNVASAGVSVPEATVTCILPLACLGLIAHVVAANEIAPTGAGVELA